MCSRRVWMLICSPQFGRSTKDAASRTTELAEDSGSRCVPPDRKRSGRLYGANVLSDREMQVWSFVAGGFQQPSEISEQIYVSTSRLRLTGAFPEKLGLKIAGSDRTLRAESWAAFV